VALLDLKKDATIGLDGQTIVLRTDDFVGVTGIEEGGFHLVSVRPEPKSSLATGFVLCSNEPVIRKYDPQTEEVSSQEVDPLTRQNLTEQISNGQLPPNSLIEHDKIVSTDQKINWENQTKYIVDSNILARRGLKNGDKIIPGSYDDENEADTRPAIKKIVDGKSVDYPCIPVVDTALSLRSNRHAGTKRYLSKLSPAKRTKLFVEPKIANRLLGDVLVEYYDSDWKNLLGDLQLSYTLFLYLQCLGSLEHWKDLVAMLSLVEASGMKDNPEMYKGLLSVLPHQISSMDNGFLEDVDEAGNNFLLPSLRALCKNLSRANICDASSFLQLQRLLSNKFPSMLIVEDDEDVADSRAMEVGLDSMDDGNTDNDDDSDGPVVVDMVDVEASLARSSQGVHPSLRQSLPASVLEDYPLLVAAILPHEDILMTCARALDEQKDVSLVREAASYLENVEQKKF